MKIIEKSMVFIGFSMILMDFHENQ